MKPLAAATGYLVAVACIAVAGVARWLFDPWLGDHLPFATFFVAVAAAAWLGGLRPALLATLLGFLLAEYFFVPPRFSFLDTSGPHLFGLAMYFMVCFAFAAFGEAMRHAQLQSELRRERLRITLASIGDAVITTDTEGRITSLNAVAESLTGWKNDEAAGQPLETVFHIVNENTRKPVDNPVTRALREGVIVGLANHTVLIAKDGTQRPIDDSAAPIQDEQGKVAGVVLIFRDITERKRAAEELARSHRFLERVAQATPDMIFVYDLIEERNVYINRSLETTLGYTVEQLKSFPGDLTARMVHPDDLASVREFQRRFDTAEDGEVLEHEHRSRHADGSYRWLLAHATVFQRTAEGRAKEIIGVATDITARKRAEEELRKLTAELSEADRRKNEFLAMLAHELRNPLAPIRNALQIMRLRSGNGEAVESTTEMMERQVGQMVRLVDDLLDVSRISRGKIELRKGRIELASAVNHAVEAARPPCESKGLELTVTLPPKPVYLDGDPTRLAQIVGNLLSNACKFTERGGRIELVVSVECRVVSEEKTGEFRDDRATLSGAQGDPLATRHSPRATPVAVIRVRDTGMGIAADQLPRIFEMFTQVDASLERTQSGLGIGLTLVKELVEMHGGTVEAHSAGIGQGSQFVVRLPILDETREPPPEPAVSAPIPTTPRRILVVDDNWDSAESLAILLELTGNETHTAYDGLEAVEAAATFKPDVVLLDIGLPKMNGFEAACKIREQPWGKKMVLVALTGWGQDEDRQKSREAGFDGHLVKPVDYAALTKLLAELGGG